METALIIYTQDGNVPYVADLYENETIALQYSFNDIKDLKPSGTYSRTFRIPATNNNAQIFGFIEQNTFQFSNFNPKRKLNAIITVDTLPVMEGSIQFKAAYTSNGVVSEYEIVFFGNVIDFFKNIGDADFKNYIAVQLQNDYDITVDYVTISDVINEVIGDGNIQFTLTDRGDNWVGNTVSIGTKSIYSNSTTNVIKAGNLTPMVKSEYIFNKIIELSGFSLDSTNSGTLLNELGRLFIPFTSEANQTQQIGNPEEAKFLLENFVSNPQFDYTDFALQTVNNESQYIYEIPNLIEVTDGGNNVLNNTYTAPFSGNYLITATANLSLVSPFVGTNASQMQLIFIKTNNSSVQTLQGSSPMMQWYTYDNNYNQIYYTDVNSSLVIGNTYTQQVYLEAGETIRPVIYLGEGSYFTLQSEGTIFEIQTMNFKCNTLTKPIYGNVIDWVANAPVMKCTEFMSAIFKMFNLVVISDAFNPKLLSFIPIQEYLASGETKDWSNKLDISKDFILTPTTDYQSTINSWTYKQSSDYLNNIYNTQGNRIYGRLQLLDPENDFATKEQKIELEFGSTPLALIAGTDYPIAKFINESVEYVNPTPRILFKTSDVMTIHILNDDTLSIDSAFTIPLFSHYQNIIPDYLSNDYNFGQETPLHPVTQIPYNTLYARFWNDYIANIYAPDARIMEAFFALEFADIYNFKYNDKIFIKDSYWRILEISDYVVGIQESIKVKLMKVINVAAPCNLQIDSISSSFNVLFIDSEGNISNGTQTCCNAYGYNWDSTQNRCYPTRQDGNAKQLDIVKSLSPSFAIDENVIQKSFVNGSTNIVGEGNNNSIVTGTNNYLDSFNDNSLIAGTNLIVNANVGSSIIAFGNNANVINKGLTIGGTGNYNGEIQTGIVHAWGSGNFTNNTTYIDLKIEGADNYNIPTDTNWILKILLSGMQYGLSGMDGIITGEYNIHVVNRNTTVLFINATTIDETFDNLTGYLVWDLVISGETFYPRVKLVGSSTYPENDIKLSALTTFTQYHYE